MTQATGASSFLTPSRLALAALALIAALVAAPVLAQDASSSASAEASTTAVADEPGMPPLPADAPSADQVAHGLDVWKNRGGCFNCHGDFAQGGTGGHFPAGPSLRKTQLDLTSLRDIISCGIPGTPMPYNLADAYTKISCYSSEAGPAPQGTAPGAALTAAEITDLIAYLKVDVIGQRRITKKQCVDYYGDPNYPDCAAYH